LETICWHLKGSAFWPDFAGSLLFLETSEEAPSPAAVDGYLTDLEQLGVFDAASGLLIGRPYGYEEEALDSLFRVVVDRTGHAGIPVLANVDLGHTDPMLTLPIGTHARMDADARTLELLESPTRPPGVG
jgi:muramoyltetrapeptide carboxypeptidase LdcA involved in peptidoglycan recycling